jgi:chemotaxis methyl-accepting protein methylase
MRLNLAMTDSEPIFHPTLDPVWIRLRLHGLLIPGEIDDRNLENRIDLLDERFRIYAASVPFGIWAPGLDISHAMRSLTEALLPVAEIRSLFRRMLALSLTHEPFFPSAGLWSAPTWLDFLTNMPPELVKANPARLLRRLLRDGEFRCRFLFALFLPRRFGGGFGRYPAQADFLRRRLETTGPVGTMCCLDAACGSGEGTYELALLLLESGYAPERMELHGVTVEPLELFAAAHGWFPHDPARQAAFRSRTGRLFKADIARRITFMREDLTAARDGATVRYDIILCNGLLGGPLLHGCNELEEAVGRLCRRLKRNGMLLAADHFHGGWKKDTPRTRLREMLAGNGLEALDVDEGVAGVRRED